MLARWLAALRAAVGAGGSQRAGGAIGGDAVAPPVDGMRVGVTLPLGRDGRPGLSGRTPPPPAPAAVGGTARSRLAFMPPLSAVDREVLIRTVWGEARGEPEAGQVAVVHVVRNRVMARGTSAAIECQRPWQFSAWNPGDPNRRGMLALGWPDPEYQRIAAVVDRAWTAPDVTGGARHYHVVGATPAWARPPAVETLRVGRHVFLAGVP